MSDAEDRQADTIRFLADPATHGGAEVERVDTHISRLFLAGDRVFKLRRAVRTNFLDFTGIEARRADCDREIEVNHAARALYLGVRAVTRGPQGLALDGAGEPVDWVVEMRRFDRSLELDRMAGRCALTRPILEALADRVAAMHARAPARPFHGGPGAVRATVDQIADGIAEAAPDLRAEAQGWAADAHAAIRARAGQLDARRRHGRVRRGHGDLHLGNIVMLDGRPTPFDALEFSEEMASTDLLYDIAFTVMDLIGRDLAPLAGAFLCRYLSVCRDHSGLSLLALFVSMRAGVRALVAASRPAADAPPAADQLAFARTALTTRPWPRLIAVGGLSGTGKSTLARAIAPGLAPLTGAVVIRSDVARKRLFGVAPEDPLPEAAYAPETGARVHERLAREAGRTLRAGWPVVLDATFLAGADRAGAEALAADAGVPFTGLWLDAPLDLLAGRLAARRGDASDADAEVLRAQARAAPDPANWIHLDASGTQEEVAAAASDRLGIRTGGS